MAEPVLMQIDHLPVDKIDASKRKRPIDQIRVNAIISSVEEIGSLINPITVRREKGGKDVLLAGGHRLEAYRQLKRAEIPVRLWSGGTKDWALLVELDENLAGGNMTPLDMAVFLAERKKAYEKRNPQTKQGMAGAKARHAKGTMPLASFVATAAQSMATSETKAKRLVQIGNSLSADQVRWLRNAPKPTGFNDLLAIAKIEDDAERSKVCIDLTNGDAKNVGAARAAYAASMGTAPAPLSAHDKAFSRLEDAWTRAPMSAKRAFIEEYGSGLQALLGAEDDE